MELWFLLLATLCLSISLHSLLNLLNNNKKRLPPGPPTIPFIGNFLWLLKATKNFSNMEPILRLLRSKHGSIVTLRIGPCPAIFITNNETAHRALIQGGATFADRPPSLLINEVLNSNQKTVHSAPYGPVWRVLRQNFMSTVHPSKIQSYSPGRKWALKRLKDKLLIDIENSKGDAIYVLDHFRYVMYCLLAYMCFGEELEEEVVKEIEKVQRDILVNLIRYNILNFMPRLGKILFRKLWKELLQKRRNLECVFLPIIKARIVKKEGEPDDSSSTFFSYVDTFSSLQLPSENGERKERVSDDVMVSLCAEFFNGGTDTSTATLQWAMANLVKYQHIQEKLLKQINDVVKPGEEIKDEDIHKMPYLKAVIFETLRRHPPGHFLLPHAVTSDTIFEGYHIPKNALVNFTVAEMAWDRNVWGDDAMEFRPERFLSESSGGREVDFDPKGVRGIKMMPFGAGRRVCPAITVAMFHLEYVVANLVRDFKWRAEEGDDVDMSEKQDFTIVMKNPLQAKISPRMSGAMRFVY